MPKLNYIRRKTVDKLYDLHNGEVQYEALWVNVSQRKITSCIKCLVLGKAI